MGAACGTRGGEEKCIEFYWGNFKERHPLEDLGLDRKILLKFLLGVSRGYVLDLCGLG
jgi:hypothetical protein